MRATPAAHAEGGTPFPIVAEQTTLNNNNNTRANKTAMASGHNKLLGTDKAAATSQGS